MNGSDVVRHALLCTVVSSAEYGRAYQCYIWHCTVVLCTAVSGTAQSLATLEQIAALKLLVAGSKDSILYSVLCLTKKSLKMIKGLWVHL